jgi:hypothetical protein
MHARYCLPIFAAAIAIPFAALTSATAQSVPTPNVLTVYSDIPIVPFSSYCELATDCVEFVVVGQEAAYSASGLGCTRYKASVVASTLGRLTSDFLFYVGGSEFTNPIVRVPGAPSFNDGERALAFFWTDPTNGEISLLGLAQGVYRLDPETAQVRGLYALQKEQPDQFRARVLNTIEQQH